MRNSVARFGVLVAILTTVAAARHDPTFFPMRVSLPATCEKFLLWEGFEDTMPPAWPQGWRVENTNGDSRAWETREYGGLGLTPQCASYRANPSLPANDWFFTPALSLSSGIQYTLGFHYKASASSNPEKVNVWFGSSQASGSMTTKVFENGNVADTVFRQATSSFTVPASGTYYLGFHCYSDADRRRLLIDDIRVSCVGADLEVQLQMIKPFLNPGQNAYPSDTTMECHVFIRNTSGTSLLVNGLLTVGHPNDQVTTLSFTITSPSGETLPFQAHYDPAEPNAEDFRVLEPGGTAFAFWDLNSGCYDFAVPGSYTVQAVYKNYLRSEGRDVWRGEVRSDPQVIRVTGGGR
jgi:hypothetical protein